ncbi:MAG: hypothetical protein P9L92_15755 [Candidatus Electryonea clarkiae]|nr:hypothetical protein [Candidatus Electryonea clarkiae]MDP8285765.1 hypothetical protein [Candidatus Electryonea clarkiae]
MSKLLVPVEDCWYHELSQIASYQESDFERTIKQQVEHVFPDYITISYKKTIYADGKEPRIPDLAMINKNYDDWWIVEVELSNHTINHVISQVDVFANGNYNSELDAKYILERIEVEQKPPLEYDKLKDLIKNKMPQILVIVDEPKTDWINELSKYNTIMMEFQTYKNTNGHEAYRISGEHPEVFIDESHCRYAKGMNNLLEILNPTMLDSILDDDIRVTYNGKTIICGMIDFDRSKFLRINGINPIIQNKTYVLYKDTQGNFILKQN